MKHTFLTLAAVTAAVAFSGTAKAQADQPIGTLLPEDTSVLMMVRDLSTFYELPDDHAINNLMNHPAIQHLSGEALDEAGEIFSEETMEEMGVTEEQLAQWFPGRLALAARLDLEMLLDAATEGALGEPGGEANVSANLSTKGLSFLAAADTTITEAEIKEIIDGMVTRMKETEDDEIEDARAFQDQFEGFPMTRLETKTFTEDGDEVWTGIGFILANEMLIITQIPEDRSELSDSIATDMVQRIKSGGAEAGALAGNRSFIDSADQLEEADLFLFAPLENIATAGETALGSLFDDAANDPAGGPGINMFLTKDGLLDFLGLTDFKRMTVAAKIQPDGIEMVQELAVNERTGIIAKMVNYEQGIQLPEMDPAGLTGITVSGYKLAESIEMLLTELPKLSPMLGGMLQMQMAQMENQGLKIQSGMLPAMGNGLIYVQAYATPEPADDQVPSAALIFNATDPAGLGAAMGEIAGFVEANMGGGEVAAPREFMGEQIFDVDSLAQMIGPMLSVGQANSAAYSIVGDKLIMTVGEKAMMDHVIASLKKGTSSLEDHETLSESWKMWGNENLVEFGYSDLATQIKAAIYGSEEGIAVRGQVGETTEGEDTAANIIKDMPSLKGLDFSITEKTYDTPDGWVTRAYIAEKPGK